MNANSSSLARALFPRSPLALLVALSLLSLAAPRAAHAQQPRPAPSPQPSPQQRTGRSYDGGSPLKTPPPPAPQAPSPVVFTDITAAARVNFRHQASPTSRKYLMEAMGAGVALLDYDADGRLDIYFTNGARLDDPMQKADSVPDKREARFWNRLYRQKADGTFEDVTERAGVRGYGYDMGAAAGDFDADGYTDLYVTSYGANTLYRNRGDGTFEDVSRKMNVAGGGWSTSAGWLDYNNDGRLDLFVARYMDWDFARGDLYCGDQRPGLRAYCHPDNFKGATNLLYRQKADGTFEDVSREAGFAADASGKGLGVAFADFDADGFTDIVVANDSVRQSLYHNKGDGTFADVALLAGVGYDENGKTFAGMGVDAADYDNDGQPDIFITVLSNETYPLYQNTGEMTFNYVTQTTGVAQITLLYTGWGTRFADFDNDGWRDLFVAQGHVLDTIEKTSSYIKHRQTPLLMRGVAAKTGKARAFVDVSASAGAVFNQTYAARGAAFGDLDSDGDTDIVMAITDGAPVLLRNEGTKNRWLGLVLAGTKSHRSGAGARVVVTDTEGRRQTFDATNAGSYLSANDARLLVGLGAATGVASIEFRWPSGQRQTVMKPEIGRYLTIREP